MFPGGNTNANLGYNKHNQYMARPTHFIAAPGARPGPVPVLGAGLNQLPGSGVGNRPAMPLNIHGGIDWAQLAQQWIHMRDSSAAPTLANFSTNMPNAPPPPIINNAPEYHQQQLQQPEPRQLQPKTETYYEEHGEAEMDMDMDDEDNINHARAMHNNDSLPPPPVVTQSQWIDASTNDMPIAVSNDAVVSGTQQWNNWSTRANSTAHIPSLLKLNICNPNDPQQLLQQTQLTQQISSSSGINSGISGGSSGAASSDIDANKRKMLPAWIREGLEKMEREKQRQLERQQPTTPEDELPAINVKQVSSKSLTTPVNLLNISNVASDSEDSIAAPEEATYAPSMAQLIGNDVICKSSSSSDEATEDIKEEQHSQQPHQQDAVSRHNVAVASTEAALTGKNYEERLADLMLVVRRTLTEILLETTNEEIAAIATETLKAHRAKASSAQVIRKSALSSITGNLGLAVYGDSSSESGDDDNTDDEDVERNFDKEADKSIELSSDELRARIRKSKRSFERVIDEIEERVSLQEKMDEQQLQHHRKVELEQVEASKQSNKEPPADEAAAAATATQTENLLQFNGKRLSRKERTTRFSDNKDGKQSQSFVSQVVAAAAAQSSVMPQKLKPVPNPATNLLQVPESMVSMLSAANKALDKAQKTSKKTKSRRRRSSSSSSSGSSGDSSTSRSTTNSSSKSSKSSGNSGVSSTRSSIKKHGKSSHRHSSGSSNHRHRSDSSRKTHRKSGHSSSSNSRQHYDRHHSRHESRDRERERERHANHNSQNSRQRHRHQQRDSSNSADEDGSGHRHSSRHSSTRSLKSSSYGKHRQRTRSRSNSRSTHNSYSSASTSHQQRKRK